MKNAEEFQPSLKSNEYMPCLTLCVNIRKESLQLI